MTKPSPAAYRTTVLAAAANKKGRIRCAKCRRHFPASQVDVDHKRPTIDGGSDDLSNLQVLCRPDHKAKTAREAKRRARGPLWPNLLAGSAVIGALVPQADAFLDWAHTRALPALAPTLHASAGGALIGTGLAALVVTVPVAASRWWAAGAPPVAPTAKAEAVPERGPRVEAAVRDIVGSRGTITVADVEDRITVTYAGTGLADEDDETRVKVIEKVSAKLGGRWVAAWDTTKDTVVLSPRVELPEYVEHPGFPAGRDWRVLPVGVDSVGRVASFDLNSTPHLLIVGNTGKGKTSLVRSLIEAARDSASRGEVDLMLIDPKEVEFGVYDGAPNVAAVHTDTEAIYDALLALEVEMRRRNAHYRKTYEWDSKPIIVVVDELRVLFKRLRKEAVARKESPTNTRPPAAQAALEELLFLGRSAGIHVIGGTQAPDASWLGGDVRSQMEGRALVGPSVDGRTSRMAFGSSAYARDVPPHLKGRTTMQILDEEPQEIQAYWTPPPKPPRFNLTKTV